VIITNAQWVTTDRTVHAEFDGVVQFVPVDPANAHWQEIQAAVAAEALSIADAPPPPAHEVRKLAMLDRLAAAGLWPAAKAAMQADTADNPGGIAWERWQAAIAIRSDDPLVIGLLTLINANPAEILAP